MKSNAKGSIRNHTIKSNTTKSWSACSRSIARVMLVVLFFSLLLPAPRAMVQNREQTDVGDLVTTFGTGGVVMTDFAGGHDSANAVTTTRFGKIIAAGSATVPGNGTDFALACYDENGNLDPTFGDGGRVTVDFFGANDGARGAVVQPDQKIVLSGFATNGSERQWAFARFNADGSLDPTFDQDGKVVLDLGSTSEAFKLALQEDLKIVAVGDSRPQNSLDFTVVRLNPSDGSLDNSFGGDGVVTINFGNVDRAIDLAIDEENIFVCGFVVTGPTDSDFGIARLNISDGSLNNEFGGDGTVTTDYFGKQDGAQAILLRGPTFDINEKHLIVGGLLTDETQDFALATYRYNGILIDSFFLEAQFSKTTFDFNGSRDQVFDLIDEPDGGIGAIGWAGDGDRFDLGVATWDYRPSKRWEFSGNYTLDTASGENNVAFAGMIYEDTIITAGTGLNPASGNDDFTLTRHENEKYAEIIKRAPATPVVRGDIITYTFEINNLTDNELSLVVIDGLPVGVTFEESQNTGWRDRFPDGFLSNSPERRLSVPGGQTSFISLRVRADKSGILKNRANLLLPDPNDPEFRKGPPIFLGSSEVESEVIEPVITGAVVQKKKLFVFGNYPSPIDVNPLSVNGPQAKCPTILIDGQEQKTKRDPDNPTTVLIAKKGGKKIAPGQTVTLKVRLCDGTETAGFTFTRPQ